MHDIRRISLTVLALLATLGVACYFITTHVSDGHTSSTTLFILSWLFSSAGVVGAASVIGACLLGDKFGTRAFISELLKTSGVIALLLVLVEITLAGIVYLESMVSFDAGIFISSFVAVFIGYIIGLFIILGLNAREGWSNQRDPFILYKLHR